MKRDRLPCLINSPGSSTYPARKSVRTTRATAVHATQVTAWKTELLENAAAIFGGDVLAADGKERIRELQAKIGELTMENSFLEEGALGKFPGLSGKR